MISHDFYTNGTSSAMTAGVENFWSETMTRNTLAVTNGNVQGNHRDPYPFSFQKNYGVYGRGRSTQVVVQFGKVFTNYEDRVGNALPPDHLVDTSPFLQYASLEDTCMEKIYDQIRGHSNMAVDLAESAMTLKMLRGTLNLKKLLAEFFKELVVPKKLRGASSNQRRLDYITGKWLEHRYGWMPLTYSIYDAFDTLGGYWIVNNEQVVKGSSQRKVYASDVTGNGTTSIRYTRSSFSNTRMRIYARFSLPPQQRVRDWTNLNPASIAWELVPLSFVADWIVNVSQQLSLWENYLLYNMQFLGGYKTITSLQTTTGTEFQYRYIPVQYFPSGGPVDGGYTVTRNFQSHRRTTELNRTILINLPTPNGIRLKVSFGWRRQLDAAALIHQLVAKKFR